MEVKISELFDIYNHIKKRVRNKRKIYYFEKNKISYIMYIKYMLENNLYDGGHYNVFLIKWPKMRVIMSTGIIDKIIDHYLNQNILLKNLEKYLIDENVATRKNLGVSAAIKKLKIGIEKHKKYDIFYFLKIDIKKFFYNIDHNILKQLLKEKLNDEDFKYIEKTIDATNKKYINKKIEYYEKKYNLSLPRYNHGKGLPIGNVTSQFLSVFYLYKLHHYIKHNLHIKYFIIYMDDYVLLHYDKNYLKKCLVEIESILKKYKLEINKNKTYILNSKEGIPFLGYNIKVKNNKTIITMSRKAINNIKKGVKRNKYLYSKGYINESTYFTSMMNYKRAYSFANNKKNNDIINYLG